MSLSALSRAWKQFWFNPESAIPVAVARMAFGLLLIQFVVLLAPEAHTLLGEKSVLPRMPDNAWWGNPAFSILDFLPRDDRCLDWLLGMLMVCAVCVTVGICTRLSAFLIFVIMSSFYARNAYAFGASDSILRTVMFLLTFSHAGDAWSLSRLLSVWFSRRCPEPSVSVCKPWALRMIQVHFALVWWVGCTRKLQGVDWMNGTAVYYVTHVKELARYPLPFLPDNLLTARMLTWSTMVLEFSLAILIWIEDFRVPLIVLGTFFHLAMDWALWVPQFEFVMIAGLITFLTPANYGEIGRHCRNLILRLGAIPCLAEYDSTCDLSCRMAEMVRRMDIFKLVDISPAELRSFASGGALVETGIAVSRSASRLTGVEAALELSKRLPLLMPFYLLLRLSFAPGMCKVCWRALSRIYRQPSELV